MQRDWNYVLMMGILKYQGNFYKTTFRVPMGGCASVNLYGIYIYELCSQ